MFFILRFIIVWSVWLLLADKKRWRELFTVGIFASLLGTISDSIMQHYPLWHYKDPMLPEIVPLLLDDFGIYIVFPYLFIQWLPQQKILGKLLPYWFLWTGIAIGIEWIHVVTNHMGYFNGWNMRWSYLSDWILLWVFYKFHQLFKLGLLNDDK